jgi:hypothetical protein
MPTPASGWPRPGTARRPSSSPPGASALQQAAAASRPDRRRARAPQRMRAAGGQPLGGRGRQLLARGPAPLDRGLAGGGGRGRGRAGPIGGPPWSQQQLQSHPGPPCAGALALAGLKAGRLAPGRQSPPARPCPPPPCCSGRKALRSLCDFFVGEWFGRGSGWQLVLSPEVRSYPWLHSTSWGPDYSGNTTTVGLAAGAAAAAAGARLAGCLLELRRRRRRRRRRPGTAPCRRGPAAAAAAGSEPSRHPAACPHPPLPPSPRSWATSTA